MLNLVLHSPTRSCMILSISYPQYDGLPYGQQTGLSCENRFWFHRTYHRDCFLFLRFLPDPHRPGWRIPESWRIGMWAGLPDPDSYLLLRSHVFLAETSLRKEPWIHSQNMSERNFLWRLFSGGHYADDEPHQQFSKAEPWRYVPFDTGKPDDASRIIRLLRAQGNTGGWDCINTGIAKKIKTRYQTEICGYGPLSPHRRRVEFSLTEHNSSRLISMLMYSRLPVVIRLHSSLKGLTYFVNPLKCRIYSSLWILTLLVEFSFSLKLFGLPVPYCSPRCKSRLHNHHWFPYVPNFMRFLGHLIFV